MIDAKKVWEFVLGQYSGHDEHAIRFACEGLLPPEFVEPRLAMLTQLRRDRIAESEEKLERLSRQIYEGWSKRSGYVSWVAGGNSLMQQHARLLARSQG
jgi:hypothetical protein